MTRRAFTPALIALGVCGCGEPSRPVQPVVLPAVSAPAPSPAPSASASAAAPTEPAGRFDRGAAQSALSGVSIDHCLSPAASSLSGAVILVFAPTGVITSVKVEGPLAGTPAGSCVGAAFGAARVPPFDGPPMVVRRSFHAP